ncbi:hypothetical protein [Roseivivax sp.]
MKDFLQNLIIGIGVDPDSLLVEFLSSASTGFLNAFGIGVICIFIGHLLIGGPALLSRTASLVLLGGTLIYFFVPSEDERARSDASAMRQIGAGKFVSASNPRQIPQVAEAGRSTNDELQQILKLGDPNGSKANHLSEAVSHMTDGVADTERLISETRQTMQSLGR